MRQRLRVVIGMELRDNTDYTLAPGKLTCASLRRQFTPSQPTFTLCFALRFWIKRFGAPIWWCTSIFELAHKSKVKQPSLRTNSSLHAEASMLARAMRVDLVLAWLHERAREEEEAAGGYDSDDEASAAEDSSGGDGGGALAASNRALHQLTPKNRHKAHRVARPRTVLVAAGEAGGGADAAGAAAAAEGQGAAAAALASARTGAADAAIAHLTGNNCDLLDKMLGLLAEHERERRGEEPEAQERLDVNLETLRVHNGMRCYEPARDGKRRLAFSAACSGAWRGVPGGRFDSIETQVMR